jgi:hypothetical protein
MKTRHDIEQRYFEVGGRRASPGVALSDFCWSIVLTKEYIWEFPQRQGFMPSPVEMYGEMELLRLLDQFFDRALCFAAEGFVSSLPDALEVTGMHRESKLVRVDQDQFVPSQAKAAALVGWFHKEGKDSSMNRRRDTWGANQSAIRQKEESLWQPPSW